MKATAKTTLSTAILIVLLNGTLVTSATAQSGVYAYPSAGQTQEQQDRDRWECHQWAVRETGFDPATAPQIAQAPLGNYPPARQQQQRNTVGGPLNIGGGGFFKGGGLVGDTATGAALGAAGGAIAGNAGEGAVIGAGAAALVGLLSRSSQPKTTHNDAQYQQQMQQQQYAQQQAQLQRDQEVQSYQRAYGACMTARNYTVQ
jgi:hypothetical protein